MYINLSSIVLSLEIPVYYFFCIVCQLGTIIRRQKGVKTEIHFTTHIIIIIIVPLRCPNKKLSKKSLIFKFILRIKVIECVCVCLYRKISLTAEPRYGSALHCIFSWDLGMFVTIFLGGYYHLSPL